MTLKRRDEKPTRKWKHAADGADAARLSLGGGRGGAQSERHPDWTFLEQTEDTPQVRKPPASQAG